MTSHHSVSLEQARSVVSVIMGAAKDDSLELAVAVTDRGGELLCFERTDGCGLPSIQVALSKAFSAARLKQSTREFLKDAYDLANLADSRYTSYPGGFPVMQEGVVIGGIGVSGLSPEEDEAMVQKGLSSLFS